MVGGDGFHAAFLSSFLKALPISPCVLPGRVTATAGADPPKKSTTAHISSLFLRLSSAYLYYQCRGLWIEVADSLRPARPREIGLRFLLCFSFGSPRDPVANHHSSSSGRQGMARRVPQISPPPSTHYHHHHLNVVRAHYYVSQLRAFCVCVRFTHRVSALIQKGKRRVQGISLSLASRGYSRPADAVPLFLFLLGTCNCDSRAPREGGLST